MSDFDLAIVDALQTWFKHGTTNGEKSSLAYSGN